MDLFVSAGEAATFFAALFGVLELEPNHAAARAALGYQRIGGLWISREERAADAESALGEERSLAKFGSAMREIAAGLAKESSARREAAAKRLLAVRDPAAIPAMEAIVSPFSDEAARLAVDVLAEMNAPAASLSLAGQIGGDVLLVSYSVRRLAAGKFYFLIGSRSQAVGRCHILSPSRRDRCLPD